MECIMTPSNGGDLKERRMKENNLLGKSCTWGKLQTRRTHE
jgi:hypothetical protein